MLRVHGAQVATLTYRPGRGLAVAKRRVPGSGTRRVKDFTPGYSRAPLRGGDLPPASEPEAVRRDPSSLLNLDIKRQGRALRVKGGPPRLQSIMPAS